MARSEGLKSRRRPQCFLGDLRPSAGGVVMGGGVLAGAGLAGGGGGGGGGGSFGADGGGGGGWRGAGLLVAWGGPCVVVLRSRAACSAVILPVSRAGRGCRGATIRDALETLFCFAARSPTPLTRRTRSGKVFHA